MKNVILGVDPGTRRTGFGLIRLEGDRMIHIDHGVIRLKEEWSLPKRLEALNSELENLYQQFPVHRAPFMRVDPASIPRTAERVFT